MKTLDRCKHCGKPESEHHAFVPFIVPDRCECNPNDWLNPNDIPPVCNKFELGEYDLCKHCEHPKECHKP